jgi:hypothetical protein
MSSWWNVDWTKRIRLTIDNSGRGALTNFPIAAFLTDPARIDYNDFQTNGEDVRIVDSDGNQVAHEIDVWDTSGTSIIHFKKPSIAAGSTTDYVYLYYGNGTCADDQDAPGVWSNNYRAVWHFSEASGNIVDSIAGYVGVLNGIGWNHQQAAQMGVGLEQDGGAFINAGDQDAFSPTSGFTWEALVKRATPGSNDGVISKDKEYLIWAASNGLMQAILYDNDQAPVGSIGRNAPAGAWPVDSWQYLFWTWDGGSTPSSIAYYLNDVQKDATDSSWMTFVSMRNTSNDLILGQVSGQDFDGIWNELRISTGVRSADWRNATYDAMWDNVLTYSSPEANTYALWPWTDQVFVRDALAVDTPLGVYGHAYESWSRPARYVVLPRATGARLKDVKDAGVRVIRVKTWVSERAFTTRTAIEDWVKSVLDATHNRELDLHVSGRWYNDVWLTAAQAESEEGRKAVRLTFEFVQRTRTNDVNFTWTGV